MGKMKFTNNAGLPLPIQIWLATNDYDFDNDPKVISVTTLLKPVQMIVLGRRYKDVDKEADFSDFIASKLGSSIHTDIEKALQEDNIDKIGKQLGIANIEEIKEKLTVELRTKLEIDDDFKISGKFDMVYDGTVCDIKTTSVWKWIYEDIEDFRLQMSMYKYLNQTLITNDHGYIFYIFTDWSKAESKRKQDYPQSRIVSKKIKLYTIPEIEEYITNKLNEIRKAEKLSDNMLPECTPEERWEKPPKWKYYKNPSNMTRATKNYDNQHDAEERRSKDGGLVVFEAGESTRCSYCSYTNFCHQYIGMKTLGYVK